MSDKERNEAVIGRVKENIEKQTQSQYGLLEMQSRWAAWREAVIAMDLSWNNMFQFGDSLIGFALVLKLLHHLSLSGTLTPSSGSSGASSPAQQKRISLMLMIGN